MREYNVIELKHSQYDYLVIANTYENPINDLLYKGFVPFIENGHIIFDLTVINGISNNRYAFAKVENHKIITNTINVSSKIDDNISNIIFNYFLDNSYIIKNSSLPSAMKYTILHS